MAGKQASRSSRRSQKVLHVLLRKIRSWATKVWCTPKLSTWTYQRNLDSSSCLSHSIHERETPRRQHQSKSTRYSRTEKNTGCPPQSASAWCMQRRRLVGPPALLTHRSRIYVSAACRRCCRAGAPRRAGLGGWRSRTDPSGTEVPAHAERATRSVSPRILLLETPQWTSNQASTYPDRCITLAERHNTRKPDTQQDRCPAP